MKKRTLKTISAARKIALVGIMTAIVECGKLVLAAIPNVEVVTLLLALFGYVFGYLGVLSALVFVCIEPLIWGFGSWMLSYFIHWPLVALVFWLLGATRVKNRFCLSGITAALTAFFGVLTSAVDVGFFMGKFDGFAYRFLIMYMRGIPFFATQIICNAVLFLSIFPFMARKLSCAYSSFKAK